MSLNPICSDGRQPFGLDTKVVLEKRTHDGRLDLSGAQPPSSVKTFDDVYKLFFAADPTAHGSWEALRAWLVVKGWVVRENTWR